MLTAIKNQSKLFLFLSFILLVGLIFTGCDGGVTDESGGLIDDTYNLTIEIEGEGTTEPEPGTHEINDGEMVDVEAIPDDGYEFVRWGGNVQESENEETSILMENDETVKAIFEEQVDEEDKYSISGYVIADDNSPIKNANITFNEGDFSSVTTNEEGFWEKESLHGEVEVRANKEDYSFSPGFREIDEPKDNVNFTGTELQEGQEDIQHTEKAKDLTEKEANNVRKVSEDRDKIVFKEESIFLRDLKEGDVIMSEQELPGAEAGLLKRVKEKNGKEVVIEPATLDDYIEEGSISASGSISFDEMVQQMQEDEDIFIQSVNVQASKINFKVEFDDLDDVYLEGTLMFTRDFSASVNIEYLTRAEKVGTSLSEFEFIVEPGFETEINIVAEKGKELEKEKTIGGFEVTIPVYKALDIVLEASLVAGAKGEIGTKLQTGVDYNRNYEFGVKYKDDDFSLVTNQEGEGFSFIEPTWTGSVKAKAYTGIEVTGGPRVAYTVTPGLGGNLRPNIGMEGKVQPDWEDWYWGYDFVLSVESEFFASLEADLRVATLKTKWEGPSVEFYKQNIAYGASGRIETVDGEGLDDVEVNFEGEEWFGDGSCITENGYWSRHLLKDEVVVIPEHEDYTFEPESKVITGSKSDVNFTAFPEDEPIEEYTLTMEIEGQGNTDPEEGSHTYNEGDAVNISAIPEEDWEFSHWEGEVTDPNNPDTTVTIDDDKTIIVHFVEELTPELPSPVALSPGDDSPPGQIIETLTPTLTWEEVEEAETYALAIRDLTTDEIVYNPQELTGTSHTIPEETLSPGREYRWNIQARKGEQLSPVSNTLYFQTEPEDDPIEEYTLTIETEGSGSTDPAEGPHTYYEDETVNISASPDEEWEFSHWEGDVFDTDSADTTVVMDDDKTVTAYFIEDDDEIIEFEDPNLEDAVREEINKPEGDLYISDVINITELDARGKGIESIEGIQSLINLEALELRSNEVSDISPLSDLTALEVLWLCHNEVSEIEAMKKLNNLENLNLRFNQVNDLGPISNLINLRALRLRGNQISDINPVSNLTNLKYLKLTDNQISDINPISNLINLRTLWLRDNQISDINPVSDLTNLRSLTLRNNQITEITPVSSLTNLKYLYLENNQISDISSVSNLTNLRTLKLRNNQITEITPVSSLINLVRFRFGNNKVKDINALSDLNNLTYLYFSNNKVSNISPLLNNSGYSIIYMLYNDLDLTEGSKDMDNIQELQDMGVSVHYEPQN